MSLHPFSPPSGNPRSTTGNPKVKSSIGSIEKPAAVLARTNVGVEQTPHVVGGVKELQRLLEDVVALNGGQPGICPEFFGFADWAEVLKFVGEEEGESLRMFVQVVEHLVCGGTLSVAASKRSWAQ